ncbi:MAG TPA: glycosyltransferase 87 family protein [Actinomycetota bacterium]|nr:glycosyltransferase 87 family protein [Actinomycetota bacterium]
MAVRQAALRRSTVRLPPTADILAGLGVFGLAVVPLLVLKFHGGKFPLDLAVYREAGRVVLHGGDPYARDFGRYLRIPLPFTYPPFAALGSVVLAVVGEPVAIVAWTTLSLLLLVAMVWLVMGRSLRQPVLLGLAAGALAWTVPLNETISFGQVNLLLAMACLLDCTWSGRRRGALVGVATAVKLTPGLFIAYFALTRQWAAAARAAATAAICELLAAAILPGPSRQYWFHLAFSPGRTGDPGSYTNQSVFGTLTRLHLAQWLWVLWVPIALGVGALGMWRAVRAHQEGQEITAVALVGLTGLLVSPISWQHHAVWIVLVVGVLATWATTPRRAIAAVAVLGLFLLPLPWFGNWLVAEGAAPMLGRLLENSYVLAFLVLLVTLPVATVPAPPVAVS